MKQHHLAIFASGKGTNAINIITYFKKHPSIACSFVLSNKADAPIVSAAARLNMKVIVCTNKEVARPGFLSELCKQHEVSHIILAGFLRKLPVDLVETFPKHIINIHPSLLPKYGGEGMFGAFVHQAVLENNEKETGITIHYVNEEYDKGEIISQHQTGLTENETIESIQQKIHALEMKFFPVIIEKALLK